MSGFMGKILRVDLAHRKASVEPLPGGDAALLLGGCGLATKYLFEELRPGTDPLGPENKLIFMSGPLTGTLSPSSGKYNAVTKSPLTGLWGQSGSGGKWGRELKRSGYDGIIIEGASEKPVCLVINDGKVEFRDAAELWGKNVFDTTTMLEQELGKGFCIACIGTGGENLVRYATIMNERHRALGRGGFGAVMGSKKLKAVAVKGDRKIPIFDQDAFEAAAKVASDFISESLLKMTLEVYGTSMVLDLVNVKGGLPTRNWQSGVCTYADMINAPTLNEKLLVGRKACYACPIACGRLVDIKAGKFAIKGEGPEYESIGTFGPMCDISDIEAITYAHILCNDLGLDTVSAGSTIAFAMECYEKGILNKKTTGGKEILFGDVDIMVDLVRCTAAREGIGDLLAEGTRLMAAQLGGGSERFAMNVKGMELPAYDCRATKITGLAYVTANRGGDHITAYVQGPTFLDIPFLIVEENTIEDVTRENPLEAKVVKDMEDALTTFDALGACKFMGMALMADDIVPVINAATGWGLDAAGFRQAGERIFNLARAFNVREGLRRKDDTLPARLLEEPLPDGPAAGLTVDLVPLLDAYYDYRGWDTQTGIPTVEKLRELGLDFVINQLGD
ncbi:MAG TPA: aldehyde ferredoxin oxidoreductase family protein [Deltaproteobacteria bacterium]|nr:aldehyde ferredoxin oxidoreductase family protein [Deltaproteobacteria bacterium]OQC29030.1 MAG: putative oxidoreductase YdhV [Deltaproteobacteria bacterium ADurb.Bin072]NMD39192.1 aldehyde ferredoxin oxidoreductase family protein [Deltaproteobacteria bacterium]HNQ84896.1 aldehyde ferredoxin oxidoreductase family protein [Deltaproteobacteria bacterium]HNS88770.1 aldehyde ferredoxin oxidoreductase family protein [Deltaproteobacteria bacterium]